MNELKLTPEEFAQMMKANKPHLIELEDHFKALDFGEVEVKFVVRAGSVTQMDFFDKKRWLREKEKTVV